MKLDKDDILQYNHFIQFNIHHNYRTSNMEANYLRHMSRESKIKWSISSWKALINHLFRIKKTATF